MQSICKAVIGGFSQRRSTSLGTFPTAAAHFVPWHASPKDKVPYMVKSTPVLLDNVSNVLIFFIFSRHACVSLALPLAGSQVTCMLLLAPMSDHFRQGFDLMSCYFGPEGAQGKVQQQLAPFGSMMAR